MTTNKMVRLITRVLTGTLVAFGLKRGIDLVAGKGKPTAKMTQSERQQAKTARAAVKRARQAARLTRRIGR
ncbi:hypothetical protein [Phaeovulum sp.]|uniref:hypothetical protein n=1 Tax=Phaeovulum sp. TaxID=2934796 RepID=UPI0039E35ABD